MEYVEGTTLREWLRAEPRTWQEVLGKFILAGRGLAAAHAADIIHRDFKPSNVLIGKDGDVRVADFGVAKERERSQHEGKYESAEFEPRRTTGGDSTGQDALIEEIQSKASVDITVAGRMVGTPAYMAPEQHMGLRVGPATDQYSFCVSLYEALYGRLPFEGTDRRDQLARMAEGKLPLPPKDGPVRSVPTWVHKVIARGLRPHPSERWPSMNVLLDALGRDPAKRMRTIGVVAAGALGLCLGVFGLIWGLTPEVEVSHCPALGEDIASHWNPQRRADIDRVFQASDTPYANDSLRRVAQTLDAWATTWSTTRVEVCEATRIGEQSTELLDVRIYCLDRRAREFDAMVNLLVEADDAVLERSVSAVHELGDPRDCASVRDTEDIATRRLDPAAREQIAELEADLSRALALRSAEKYDESLPLQSRVATRARALPHLPTLARALYEQAESQFETGAFADGEASLREVIELAAKLDDPEQETEAWTRLIFYLGFKQRKFVESRAWVLAASSALLRAGTPAKLAVRYESTIAALELAEGHAAEAVEHYEQALELARKVFGEDHPVTLRMLMNYASSLAQLDTEAGASKAEAAMLEVVTRSKDVFGPAHPWLATVYFNLGNAYYVRESYDKAEAAYREALAIRERVGGPNAPSLANPLTMLAKIVLAREGYAEALATLQRVLDIHIEVKGRNSAEVAGVLTDIGNTSRGLGQFDDAQRSYDEAAAIYAKLYPDGHPHVGGLEKRRCGLFIETAQWSEAAAACERALAINQQFDNKPSLQLELAKMLLEVERGRGRTAAAARLEQQIAALEQQVAVQP
jgi:tetratricopeptide (TPR) repeat protein